MNSDDNKRVERVIELNDDLLENNKNIANKNSEMLKSLGIKAFDVVGAIGAGKTLILEKIVEKISKQHDVLVINGDVTTRVDADRIEKHGAKTIQINTGRECALNAYHIYNVLDKIDLEPYDILFIENVGNLICPSDFILGTDFMRIVVVSVTEGEHVVRKHPLLFKMSQVGIINKIDLLPFLENVDVEKMKSDAFAINPSIEMFLTSAKSGENIDEIIKALGIK
ncbi:MAG: hydrogenase nickel incorporation protein HypB [Promethearchaeota archaeon]